MQPASFCIQTAGKSKKSRTVSSSVRGGREAMIGGTLLSAADEFIAALGGVALDKHLRFEGGLAISSAALNDIQLVLDLVPQPDGDGKREGARRAPLLRDAENVGIREAKPPCLESGRDHNVLNLETHLVSRA